MTKMFLVSSILLLSLSGCSLIPEKKPMTMMEFLNIPDNYQWKGGSNIPHDYKFGDSLYNDKPFGRYHRRFEDSNSQHVLNYSGTYNCLTKNVTVRIQDEFVTSLSGMNPLLHHICNLSS